MRASIVRQKHHLGKYALFFVGIVVVFVLIWKARHANKTIDYLIAEMGPPTFLAKSTELVKRRVKLLRINVVKEPPSSVENWHSASNLLLVWASSEYCQRNARFFYDDIQNDKSFDGTAWISSPTWFGEKMLVVEIDSSGNVVRERRYVVRAISIRLLDAAPKNNNEKN